MADFVTGCTHFSHKNIIKYCNRPFQSAQEMDQVLIDEINRIVGVDDRLIHLGDFSWGDEQQTVSILNKITCKNIVLVLGSHDKTIDKSPYIRRIIRVQERFDTYVSGRFLVFSHCAYAIWEHRHHGSFNLYSHSHSRAEEWLDQIMPGRWSMDCGVDNVYKLFGAYRPLNIAKEIFPIFASRPGFGLLGQRKKE